MPILGVLQQIEKDFGSFSNFKDKFIESSLSLFGSGWVWLVCKFSDIGSTFLMISKVLQIRTLVVFHKFPFYNWSFDMAYFFFISEETRKTTRRDQNVECHKPTCLGWHCKSMPVPHFEYNVLLFSEIWFTIYCCAANYLLGYVGGRKN